MQLKDFYEEYAVTGVRMQWIPTNTTAIYGQNQDVQLSNIWLWSEPYINQVGADSDADALNKTNLVKSKAH